MTIAKTLAVMLTIGLAAPAAAAPIVITFDSTACDTTCSDGSPIRQDFGDTADVDVLYFAGVDIGNNLLAGSFLRYGSSDFSGSSAVYSSFGFGEIRFRTRSPGQLTLNSVDFGGWQNRPRNISWRVYSLSIGLLNETYNLLADGTANTTSHGLTTVNFGQSSSSFLIFQFGPDGFNGGVQNINYSFTPSRGGGGGGGGPPAIPEPASWAMMIAGFGLVGATLRRRRMARLPA